VLNETKFLPRRVSAVTRAALAFPGTTISVVHDDRNMGGDEWLITGVSFNEDDDGALRFRYTLNEGNKRKPGWVDIWKQIAGGGSSSAAQSIMSGGGGSGNGGGGISGSGTGGRIAKWSGPSSIADSSITEYNGIVTVGVDTVIAGSLTASSLRSNVVQGVAGDGADLRVRNAGGQDVMVVLTATPTIADFGGTVRTPTLSATANLTVNPIGNVVFAPTGQGVNPISGYSVDLGTYDRKYRALWASELWVETLVAQETIATIGGRVLVGPTNVLVSDITPTSTTIVVKYNNLFQFDRVYFESSGKVEWMEVLSHASGLAGQWSYSVRRNLDGTGANSWAAGDACFNTGGLGAGFIDIYSIRSIKSTGERGPTIVGNVRHDWGFHDFAPRWAIGNLSGTYDYVSGAQVYGVAMGRTLKNAAGTVIGGQWMSVDDINGMRFMQGPTPTFWMHPNGNSYFYGVITAIGGSNVALWDLSNVTTIDGGKITTNSLHANRIIGGTITADKMNVGSLSAISANLGSVSAGNISGVTISGSTIYAGSGNQVTLNSSGVSIVEGTGEPNKIKWTNGSAIFGQSVFTFIDAPGQVVIGAGSSALYVGGGEVLGSAGYNLGASAQRFSNAYVTTMHVSNNIYFTNPPSTTFQDEPLVWSSGQQQIYRRTDAITANIPATASLVVRGGLVVGYS
jgi:hypothetical protein